MPDFHARLTLDAASLRLSEDAFQNHLLREVNDAADQIINAAYRWRRETVPLPDLEARRRDWLHNHVGEPLPADLRDA